MRKPQLFDTMMRWRAIAEERRLPLWEVAVQYEADASAFERSWPTDRPPGNLISVVNLFSFWTCCSEAHKGQMKHSGRIIRL